MPVSYNYKTIFIHIPKCAGSTIEKILGTTTAEEFYSGTPASGSVLVINKNNFFSEKEYLNCISKVPQHFTYLELSRSLPQSVFNTFKKFAVVRHPYTRLISDFHFILGLKLIKHTVAVNTTDWYNIYTLQDYVNWLDKDASVRIKSFTGHLETQTSYLKDSSGNIARDITIFKYENFNECLNYLKPITNFTVVPYLRKSHINKTWQDYKTPELQEKIYNFYREDFLNFDYKCDI